MFDVTLPLDLPSLSLASATLAAVDADGIIVSKAYIISGEEHRFLVLEQLYEIGIPINQGALC